MPLNLLFLLHFSWQNDQACSSKFPGLTEYRAYLSLHYAESLYWALKKGLTLIDNVSIVTRILEHLSVVINIWNKYRMGSAERIKFDQAQNLIEKIRKEYYDILCKS